MKTKLFALKKIRAPLLLSACFVPALGAAETFVTNGAGIAWTGYRSNTATVTVSRSTTKRERRR